jgi:hypothetical protein
MAIKTKGILIKVKKGRESKSLTTGSLIPANLEAYAISRK